MAEGGRGARQGRVDSTAKVAQDAVANGRRPGALGDAEGRVEEPVTPPRRWSRRRKYAVVSVVVVVVGMVISLVGGG